MVSLKLEVFENNIILIYILNFVYKYVKLICHFKYTIKLDIDYIRNLDKNSS